MNTNHSGLGWFQTIQDFPWNHLGFYINIWKPWSRGRSGIFKRGGGTNERRRCELSRVSGSMPPPGNFWKFESPKWPFPAFWDKFHTHLILNFAFVKRKSKKGVAQPSPPPSWIRHCDQRLTCITNPKAIHTILYMTLKWYYKYIIIFAGFFTDIHTTDTKQCLITYREPYSFIKVDTQFFVTSLQLVEVRNPQVQSKQNSEAEERWKPWTPRSLILVFCITLKTLTNYR